jgi:hypothetical protein
VSDAPCMLPRFVVVYVVSHVFAVASVRVLRQYLEVFLIGLRERQPDVVKYILETTNGGEADRLWHAWFPVSADDLFAVAQAKASEIGFKIGLNNTAYEQAFIQYVKIANKTRSRCVSRAPSSVPVACVCSVCMSGGVWGGSPAEE